MITINKRFYRMNESELVFRDIFESSFSGFWDWDLVNNTEYLSPAFKSMFGYEDHEIENSPEAWHKIILPEDLPAVLALFKRHVASRGQEPYCSEVRFRHKNGSVVWVIRAGRVVRWSEDGRPLRMMGWHIDITGRKEAEYALRESGEYLGRIINSIGDPVFVKDDQSRMILVNDAFCSIFGRAREEILGKTLAEDVPEDQRRHFLGIDRHVLVHGCEDIREEQLTARDAPTRTIVTKKSRYIDPGGRRFIVGVIHDITDRKEAEAERLKLQEQLSSAQRMEALGVLAGGVAHDLNNMLGPIMLLPEEVAEYIKSHGDSCDPDKDEALESLFTIESCAKRATQVVSDLVVMGRRGQFQQGPLDLNRVVGQVLETRQVRETGKMRPDIHLKVRLADCSVWCRGSESRLGRVLSNLVGNAMESIIGMGDVLVETELRLLSEPYQGYESIPEGEYAVVTVSDTGCGMDAATIRRIFEPFFSTKSPSERSGSGLGLSVVHGLVKDHAGYLDVASHPGGGSVFTVYLPAVSPDALPEAGVQAPLPGHGEHLLVVDDEPGQQIMTKHMLKRLGYTTTVVSSGEEAVALFDEAFVKNLPSPCHLVMTDLIMRGMSGMTASEEILKRYPGQKVLVVSGHASQGIAAQVKDAGIGFLSKPYSLYELARAVRDSLAS